MNIRLPSHHWYSIKYIDTDGHRVFPLVHYYINIDESLITRKFGEPVEGVLVLGIDHQVQSEWFPGVVGLPTDIGTELGNALEMVEPGGTILSFDFKFTGHGLTTKNKILPTVDRTMF